MTVLGFGGPKRAGETANAGTGYHARQAVTHRPEALRFIKNRGSKSPQLTLPSLCIAAGQAAQCDYPRNSLGGLGKIELISI